MQADLEETRQRLLVSELLRILMSSQANQGLVHRKQMEIRMLYAAGYILLVDTTTPSDVSGALAVYMK